MIEDSLKAINYLTEREYQKAKTNGAINENELYMTPDDVSIINKDVYSAYLSSSFSVNTNGEYYQVVPFNTEVKQSLYVTKKSNGVFELAKGTYLVLFSLLFSNVGAKSDVILYRNNQLVGDYRHYENINKTINGNFLIDLSESTEIELLIDNSNANNSVTGNNSNIKYCSTISFIKLL
ncbi:MAG: hypothetical protein HFH08_04400 [Bacilli bacterium]|nr:hypothetical protein [Bacilli bacterium]